MSSKQIDQVLDVYKQLNQIPEFVSARVIPLNHNAFSVQSLWCQKNMEKRSKQIFAKEYSFTSNLQLLIENAPVDVSTEILTSSSKDETLRAILREATVDGKSKQFIEIWDKQRLHKCYDLSAFDIHGAVYTEPALGAFEWSKDNTRLLYVAEKKLPNSEPFYKQKPKAEKTSDKETSSRGTEYVYKPDWGEQLVGKHKSVIVVLNIIEDAIEPITSIPEDYFPAEVIWAPNDSDIYGVAYKLKPTYHGFTMGQDMCLFHLKGKEFCKIRSEGLYCACLRLSPNGKRLAWVEKNISPGYQCMVKLMCLNLDTDNEPKTVIDTVKTYIEIADGKKFYGIYYGDLPKRCWSDDSKHIFFSTFKRSTIASFVVNVDTKTITEIHNPDGSSLSISDVHKNYLALSKSALTKPPQLIVGQFDPSIPNIGKLKLFEDTNVFRIPGGENLMYQQIEYVYDNDESVRDFNFIYFGKKGGPNKSTPLIAAIHGGPHYCYTNVYSLDDTLMALLGFGVLLINYRGSTGLGGDNIDYLPGKAGTIDVRDCITAIDTTLTKYPWLDPNKVNIYGLSYGGFMVGHLSGQYPDKFKSAIMINGVTDIPTMYNTTDIPDWTLAEYGLSTPEKVPLKGDPTAYGNLLLKMLQQSPITYVDKVKTPTLVAVGSKDLRVPLYQGKLWYKRLSENNVETKLFVYEDNHVLSRDDVDIDTLINHALWFIEHNDVSL